jgi:large subunit ribosomal protein L9
MKIILKQEFSELGAYGDIITVAKGYARNYLIPKGLAVEASKGNLRQFEAEKDAASSPA